MRLGATEGGEKSRVDRFQAAVGLDVANRELVSPRLGVHILHGPARVSLSLQPLLVETFTHVLRNG